MNMGRLRADAGPYDQPETVRMEPIPGQGVLMRFEVADNAVPALVFDGDRFERCR